MPRRTLCPPLLSPKGIAAYQELGRTEIEAKLFSYTDLQAKLAEIDENIERNPLTVLEYSIQLNDRKNIYEGMHPETKVGGAPGAGRGKQPSQDGQSVRLVTFADATAKALSKSARSIRRDLAIARGIDHSIQRAIADTPIANQKSVLQKLAKMTVEEQKREVARIKSGKPHFRLSGEGKEGSAASPKPRGRLARPALVMCLGRPLASRMRPALPKDLPFRRVIHHSGRLRHCERSPLAAPSLQPAS